MNKTNRLRDSETGLLPAFAWPGGYPIYYLDRDMEVLCAECASKLHTCGNVYCPANNKDRIVEGVVHWEGESLFCSMCNVEIESAYGGTDD